MVRQHLQLVANSEDPDPSRSSLIGVCTVGSDPIIKFYLIDSVVSA